MKAILALIVLALAGLGVLLLFQRPAAPPAEVSREPSATSAPTKPVELEAISQASEDTREEIAAAARTLDGVAGRSSPACTLKGSVQDALGKPAPLAWIHLKDELGGERKSDAGDEGHFSISGLHPGRWWAYAGARDHEHALAVLDLELARPILRHDFVLQPRLPLRVPIRVRDLAGGPWLSSLEGARRDLGVMDLAAVGTREPPDPQGTGPSLLDPAWSLASFENLRSKGETDVLGILTLREPPPLFVSLVLGNVVIDTLPLEPGDDELVFVIAPERILDCLASVRWRLVDARSGEILRDSVCSMAHGRVMIPILKPEDGWFLHERLAPRTIQIRSRPKGYAALEREVKLEPGLNDLGSIPLEPEVWIRGRVLDYDGAPVTVLLEVRRADHADRHVPGSPLVLASGGVLRIDGLERAEYVLRTSEMKPWSVDGSSSVEARGMSGSVVVSTRDGPVDGFVLQLEAPSVLVMVLDEPGCLGWRFRILEPSGRVLRSGSFDRLGPTSVRLATGPYVLELLDARQRKLSEHPLVLTAEPLRLSIPP
ncbi:MAG TPA: hypothetical protein VMS76_10465 [Planctomycetota bacterium]|nr:hypothetical protein [Planctomycetota bacterium]